MTSHSKKGRKRTGILAIILLIPPLILFLGYVFAGFGDRFMSSNERIENLLGNLPPWAQNYSLLLVISIIFCIISMILASGSYKKKSLPSRIRMLVVILISLFLILFDIGQLV